MYAIIMTGSKQYKVEKGTKVKIEKLEGDVGSELTFDNVLFVGTDGEPKIGTPKVSGVAVSAKIIRQGKDPKIVVYKKKRRKGYEKRFGHRQSFTEVEITNISA